MAQPRNALSLDERRQFEDCGLVRLPGLIPKSACEAMAGALWAEMARKDGVQRHVPSTWTTERPMHFKRLQDTGAFDAMGAPVVRALLDELMGEGRWIEPLHWGQPLVCFPTHAQPWDVPFQGWHLDGPIDMGAALIGRVFLILEPLRPRGGGTLVALGSHRLTRRLAQTAQRRLSSGEIRKGLMAAYPWFSTLMSPPEPHSDRIGRFMDRVETVGGVACLVAEMVGEAGDVWLMHPDILHGSASNGLETPRMALTQFVAPKGG